MFSRVEKPEVLAALSLQMKASIGLHEDYVGARIKKGLCPVTFELVSAYEIVNASTKVAFETSRSAMAKSDSGVSVGYHGSSLTNINSIAKSGFVRVGQPGNPNKATDAGYFGAPSQGIYITPRVSYALKYSNQLTPLGVGASAFVLQCSYVIGRTKQLKGLGCGMARVPGYHSHTSPHGLEHYIYDEKLCLPTHALEIRAVEDVATVADDTYDTKVTLPSIEQKSTQQAPVKVAPKPPPSQSVGSSGGGGGGGWSSWPRPPCQAVPKKRWRRRSLWLPPQAVSGAMAGFEIPDERLRFAGWPVIQENARGGRSMMAPDLFDEDAPDLLSVRRFIRRFVPLQSDVFGDDF